MAGQDNLKFFNHRKSPGSSLAGEEPDLWHLSIPAGPAGRYRWAQLDDYSDLSRGRFHWQAPVSLECSARVSQPDLPGTWGFGFWNDPFSAGLQIQGSGLRLPALPNTAWFFHASKENHLSLQFDRPASGLLAAVFEAPLVPSAAFLPAYPFAPLLLIPACARFALRFLRGLVIDRFKALSANQADWNTYRIEILPGRTDFLVNGQTVFTTPVAPRGRLGALVWIDNQFARLSSDGQIRFGTLENPAPAWLEIRDWKIKPLA